jgi:large subunit ribosomal protein L4
MKIDVYNQEGKIVGNANLPKEIFEVGFNADLVHQVLVSMNSNKRQNSAHTKNRGEVRGGGKKPWRQKGTGRARHGSSRSPIWRGGGITFGPRNEKNYVRDIPKKIRRKALFMLLSEKLKSNQLVLLDEIESKSGKTKEMFEMLKKLPCKNQNTLIALPSYDKKIVLSARNIKKTSIEETRNLNVLNLLNYKYLLLTKDSVTVLKDTFLK